MRQNIQANVSFGELRFVMEMFENDWGPEDPILYQALHGTFDENVSLAWWAYFAASAPPAAVLVDVGAYSGVFTLVTIRSRGDLRAVAFEASTITWSRLVRNLQLNSVEGDVLAANLAAWNSDEMVAFGHPYGIYTMCPGESALGGGDVDHHVRVQGTRLDALAGPAEALPPYLDSKSFGFLPTSNIAAVKIDVEGAEATVLDGARKLIGQARPFFICEALSAEAGATLVSFFSEAAYRHIDLPEERNIVFLPAEKADRAVAEFPEWSRRHGAPLVLRADQHAVTRIG